LFENQVEQLQQDIRAEIQRVCGGDPRLVLNDVQVYELLTFINYQSIQ
jgi:hypothetical protein